MRNAEWSLSALFLAGPTAVGKSAVALALAEQLSGEIISVDSMQVYRGLDIGTDKPPVELRRRVPHHLVDVVGLDEAFDAARFIELASRAEAELGARGRVPIFCGGTGLYFKAYLEGLDPLPAAVPPLRAELEATPLRELLAELERGDPAKYATMDRANPRRVVRAVEILRLVGRPALARRPDRPATAPAAPAPTVFALSRSPQDLRSRIDRRVEAMFASGLVDETRRLLERGLARNRTAMQALGYRQVVEHLRGERSLDDTVALVKQKTRQFAKRQRTWFRHQLPVQWIELGTDADPGAVAAQLARRWRETAL
jgi:tRNA dimethylallyltransferase